MRLGKRLEFRVNWMECNGLSNTSNTSSVPPESGPKALGFARSILKCWKGKMQLTEFEGKD